MVTKDLENFERCNSINNIDFHKYCKYLHFLINHQNFYLAKILLQNFFTFIDHAIIQFSINLTQVFFKLYFKFTNSLSSLRLLSTSCLYIIYTYLLIFTCIRYVCQSQMTPHIRFNQFPYS